jgi:hypothetical protein
MNIIRKTSKGYNYLYADLAQTHQYLADIGESYWQETETIDGEDYIVTHCLDANGKEIRKCRGCRITKASLSDRGKSNPAQEAGSSLTYARRYSLWMAYGLATVDDDGAALNPRPARKVVKPERKAMDRPKATVTKSTDKPYRQAGVDAVKRLIETGDLQLSEVKREVRRYGAEKMQDLSAENFVRCVASLTQGRGTPA